MGRFWTGAAAALAAAAAAILCGLAIAPELLFGVISRIFSPDQHLSPVGKSYARQLLYLCAGWSALLGVLCFRLRRADYRSLVLARFSTDSINGVRITSPAAVLLISGAASLLVLAAGIATLSPTRPATDFFGEEGALFGEDGVFETMTAIAFIGACVALLRAAFRFGRDTHLYTHRRRTLIKYAYLCLGLFCLGIAMEELSWGQRILGYQTPEALLPYNVQGEFNFHNLFNHFRTEINTVLANVVLLVLLLGWFRGSTRFDWFFETVFPHASLILCGSIIAMVGSLEVLFTNEVVEALAGVFVILYGYRILRLRSALF